MTKQKHRRPWAVHTIFDIYSPNVQAGLPDGRWVAAVAEGYPGYFSERVKAAWWVLTGRAHAILWPQSGDLELAVGRPIRQPSRDKLYHAVLRELSNLAADASDEKRATFITSAIMDFAAAGERE